MSDTIYQQSLPEVATPEQLSDDEVFVFPVSYAQQRMWFLDQFEPGSPYYNIPIAFRLKGEINLDIFKQAIDEIVRRHESLRTTFSTEDGRPVQIISPSVKVSVPVIDITNIPVERKENKLTQLVREEARGPFNLSAGPLFRVVIFKADAKDHVVMLTMHHIISDGWSMGVLVKEITTIYAAFLQGHPSPLPELPIQYADYSEWQREYLAGELSAKQLEYWKQQLSAHPPVLELPIDNPRPAVWTNEGDTVSIVISGRLLRKIKDFSRKEGITPFMALIGVFYALLHRYTGQSDISIGTPIANRTRKEVENLIGIFINTLVLRLKLKRHISFRELLRDIKQITLEAYENQDLPFEMLVDALQPDRDMSYPPLFQVMFILQNAPVTGTRMPGVELSMMNVDLGTATFDLTLSLAEGSSGLSVSAEFNSDLFKKATIERLLRHYASFIEQALLLPDEPVSLLQILSDKEKQKILYDWNRANIELPDRVCIHQLFEREAAETPHVVAVVCYDQSITYGELNSKANQLANYLMKMAVGPEIPVGICLDKSVDLMIALLAVLKTGSAYLPLDPSYPQERLAYMLEDAQVPVLITDSENRNAIPSYRGKMVCLDTEWELIKNEDSHNLNLAADQENLAYLIYTSGSTGKSKGTMVRHRSLVNAYYAWEKDYELRTRARNHLQMASFSFDVFTGDWVRALCSGGKLVMVPRDMLLQEEELYRLILREKINIAEFVPAVLRNLIQYLKENNLDLHFFRILIAGSDIWYVHEYKKFKQLCGQETRLINSFGLTEATIDSTFFEADKLKLADERLVPIGRPFSNMPIYILDENLQPVPIGVRGELFVAGEGIARGYLKRADLTADRFIPNPFSKKVGERLYRTGDVARFLPDGNIEFLGRIDHQVKIRGFRIELAEIETVLGEHEQIKDVAVIAREDKHGDKRLVAYLVARNGVEPKHGQLRNLLLQKLPDYMVPSVFVFLPELPLTPNGKVDRRSLPVPDEKEMLHGFAEEYVPPRNPVEEIIAKIWSEILNIEKIGIYHNFFILGGHSLLATQVISRIKEAFLLEIPLRAIFETPTVAGLGRVVERAKRSEEGIETPPISVFPRDQKLPLSFAQQRLWFLDQLEPNSPFYNIPETYRIVGNLDVEKLERSFNRVISRHETLRTTFHEDDGKPYQEIADQFSIKLHITDISSLPEKEKEQEVMQLSGLAARTHISLTKLPLFRASLLKLAADEFVFLFTIHHIISDNWSTQILMREIAIIYDSLMHDVSPPLPDLPIQYADFAGWQRNYLQGVVLEKQINYWKMQLSGAPPLLKLPYDRPRPAVQTFNGAYQTFEFSPELSRAINDFCRAENVTLFMTLLAAFQALLSRYSGQDDICIGSPIANRNYAETEGLIGFFVNTLVLRTDLSGDPNFRELVKRVREISLDAYAHQDLPFEYLVDAVQPERDLSHSPLFQVMFSLQNSQARTQQTSAGLQLSPVSAHSGTAKFDLTLFMAGEGDHIGGALEFNTDLFDAGTITNMIHHFQLLLEQFLANPDRSIFSVPLIKDDELKQLLRRSNQTEEMELIKGFFHRAFEHQVEKTPGATALVFNEQRLTYAELNKRANRLAYFLKKQGVKPDTVVAICLERSFELIVSLLGVLKAGGAYLPLDPNYPQERIDFMIQDAGVHFLITQPDYLERFSISHLQIICFDLEWQTNWDENDENPESSVVDENLAYVIYTSGSTGVPKGTLLTHHGLRNYLSWCLHAYPLSSGTGSIVHATISFDATVTAVFPSLLAGKTLYLLPESAGLEALGEALVSHKNFSLVKITPAHLEILSQQLLPHTAGRLTHSLVIGGENLTSDQIDFWQRYAPDTLLFNEYGPTETVVGCIVFEASAWRGNGSVPIGRVIPNTTVYVLDRHLHPVPEKISGELFISGAGVARGYRKRADLTAEKFIPDPFSGKSGARMYRTGDLVRLRADGNLEFLGRIDDQVKIRGYRIELGEIEAALSLYPGLEEVVVVARKDRNSMQQLVAYFVASEEDIQSRNLRNFLQQKLPDYMIPSAYVALQEMPLTPNGKINRKALPEPEFERSLAETEFVAPQTDTEKKLAEIWSQILGIEKIGIHDDFFTLGGHSLLVTQLISRAKNVFGLDLPIRTLFDAPTIAAFAVQVEKSLGKKEMIAAPPIEPVDRSGNLPLSFSQHRLWFLDQLDPGQPIYNIPNFLRLKGKLDSRAFEYSLRQLIIRHETMRTVFAEYNGEPVQVVLTRMDLPLRIVDLSAIPEPQRQNTALEIAQIDALQPFDLNRGPLFRLTLVKLSDEDQIVLLTLHHIISDGWSINILMREIALFYTSFRQNREVILPPLSVQYADYAGWQRRWLQGEVLEKQLDYWRNKLAGVPPLLELPTDRPRPSHKTFRAAHESFTLTETLCLQLNELAAKEKVTTFMLLLAAFQTLLYRYSRQDDFCIGTPIANRTSVETESIVGFFANTLVIRSDISEKINFRKLLQQVKKTSLEAYAYQDVPFEKLVEVLAPERDLSYTPLFQVMFILQNTQKPDLQFHELEMLPVEFEQSATQFDLTLSVEEGAKNWGGTFEYNVDLFDASTIKRMITHLTTLLKSVSENPAQSVVRLPILPNTEKEQILTECNRAVDDSFFNRCVHEMFEEMTEKYPDSIAVQFEDRNLTYRRLNQRANQLAAYLRKAGVGPEVVVGISIDRSVEMIVGMLGILKAGGAYLPIDPTYPPDRFDYIIKDARVNILLTQQSLSQRFNKDSLRVICLDSQWPNIAKESDENLPGVTDVKNLAYVIYTSGSTGLPKGVQLQHLGLVNLAVAQIEDFAIQPDSRVLQFASFSFDASVSETFTALLSGATLVLVRKEILMSLPDLSNYLREQKISVVTLPPSLMALIPDEDLPDLRTIVSAGETCNKDLAARWSEKYRFINAYGPTESTVGVSKFIADSIPQRGSSLPIGKPVNNTQLFVLDENMNPAPIGIPGELYIGGIGLARGYSGRPDLTAEKFVPHLFSATPGERLYRTGDLVKLLPDGNLEYIGRIDSQVKVRGFRIELGEIEANLRKHPQIDDAVVMVAAEKISGGQRLTGYLAPAQGASVTSAEIKEFLKEKLPDYMIPGTFLFLDLFPLTPHGKVDKNALAKMEIIDKAMEQQYVPPRTPVEEILCTIWEELLPVEKVGVYDHFFEIGGHSLLATQVNSRIREAFHVELPLMALFEAPQIADLALIVQQTAGEKSKILAPPIVPVSRDHDLPLSFAQQRLWFLDRMEPGNISYNMPSAFYVSGKFDLHAFEKSCRYIIARHESLRTNFKLKDGEPVQIIRDNYDFKLSFSDLSPLDEPEREKEAKRLLTKEAVRPFNLENDPLFRVSLIKLSESKQIISFVMHHIISDGWSVNVLIKEIGVSYSAFANGKMPELKPLPIQYADFASWQRAYLSGEVLEKQLNFWQEKLRDIPQQLGLPFDRPRPAMKTFNGSREAFQLTPALSEALLRLSRETGVTPFMLLLGAFQLFLAKYSGQKDICVGTPIANRNRMEIESLIGFFANTLVLRTDFSNNPSFLQTLHQVRDFTYGAFAHQDIPFEKLVEVIQPERDMSLTPLFQVMFVMQNNPAGVVDLPEVQLKPIEFESKNVQFDLTLSMEQGADRLNGWLEYNTDLFEPETVRRMIGHFITLLTNLAENPDLPVSNLSVMNETERRKITIDRNNTAADFPGDQCVHRLFEEQVRSTPDNIAIEYNQQKLTYRELNQQANKLAHFLKRSGVRAETIVGLFLDRSAEMIVSLLAIMKAGGAYLPLDPAYPAKRLTFMIADCRLPFIISRSDLEAQIPENEAITVLLDADQDAIQSEPEVNPEYPVFPTNAAYMIYTSGSTGQPKGTLLQHQGLCNLTHAQIRDFNVGAESRVLQFASFSFDASVSEIFMALLTGATLVLTERESLLSVSNMIRFFRQQKISVVTLPPSMLNLLEKTSLPDIKTIVSAGEVCKKEVAERWFRDVRFVNAYGPTEATVGVSSFIVNRIPDEGTSIPIGRPISNMQLYILDEFKNPVPPGVNGELYISGVGLARGYFNHPGLTAEKFLPNPFSAVAGARMYATGDLARFLPDGTIEFLGRIDHQVKVRGFRIELGEIESVLKNIDKVEDAIVLERKQGEYSILIGYVIRRQDSELSGDDLKSRLRAHLPEYMIPSAIVFLDRFPLTPNGKVDRKALPEPQMELTHEKREFIEPRDELESKLKGLWEEVLQVKPIGVTDDFFAIGGHSLLAVKLLAHIQNEFDKDIQLVDLFSEPTIENLARLIRMDQVDEQILTNVLYKFHDNKRRAPLFVIHPSGGSVHWYFQLAKEIGNDIPFYGIRAVGSDGKNTPHTRIEQMAAHYIAAMQTRQPQGPYYVGSWSMGVVIALEVAQQILAKGERVEKLIIFDQGPVMPPGEPEDDAAFLAGMFMGRLKFSLEKLREMSYEDQLKFVLKTAKKEKQLPKVIRLSQFKTYVSILKIQQDAWRAYKMRPYAGGVILFRSMERHDENPELEYDLGWGKVAQGGVTVFEVPGDHNTMLHQPDVKVLAGKLRSVLLNEMI